MMQLENTMFDAGFLSKLRPRQRGHFGNPPITHLQIM
jgi:hypothetical protein